jgi:L-asparaginase
LEGLTPQNLPYVEIAYSYANFGGGTIDDMVKRGAKGIVLAGVGDGNTTDAALAALERAAKAGVVVVRSSRVGAGIVDRNVEVNDDKLGFITAMESNPQKARVLLMLGLSQTKDLKDLQKLFAEY